MMEPNSADKSDANPSLREEITEILPHSPACDLTTGFGDKCRNCRLPQTVDAILAAVERKAIKLSELRIPRMGIGHPENDDYLRGYNAAIDAVKEAIHD